MAKKLAALALAIFVTTGFVAAQDEQSAQSGPKLEISGEVKTGFYWEQMYDGGKELKEDARFYNNDGDSGDAEGRFRLDLHYYNDLNMGMKVRFEPSSLSSSANVRWKYAMAYGNFINEQLRVTIGLLGLSPWGAGSIDLLKDELDTDLGIRTEIMPGILPGLNVGFVLNSYNSPDYRDENYVPADPSNKLTDMLLETVLGVAYINDYFHGSVAIRLDGEKDGIQNMGASSSQEGIELVYRLEEKVIRKSLEGFSIWAVGYFSGIGESSSVLQNYLYIDYSPAAFSARLSGGLETYEDLQIVKGRVHFYYNILPVLSVGTAFKYGQEFGENAADKASWGIEPQIRVTFNPNAYIALVYNYGQEYIPDENRQPVFSDKVQWINLRVAYTF